MYRVVTALFIGLSVFFYFASVSYAALTPEAQTCVAASSGFNCDTYIDGAIACLDNVDKSNFVWACQDFDGDAVIDPVTEVPKCSQNFATEVCDSLGGLTTRTCHDVCKDPSRDFMTKLNGTYMRKYKERTGTLATPTPTPVPASVIKQDLCTQAIDASQDCAHTIRDLDQCYDNVPPESGIWSCTKVDGLELAEETCRSAFTLRVQNAVQAKLFNACMGEHAIFGDGSTVYSYSTIGNTFDQKRSQRLQPTITPTPGVVDPDLYDNIDQPPDPDSTDKAVEVLNCGFANASDKAKQKCCPETIDDIQFTQKDGFSDCGWFDFSCGSIKRLQQFVQTNIVNTTISDKKTTYNEIIKQNGGVLPKCFVGDCVLEEGVFTCKIPPAAKICERYISSDKNPKALEACTACMGGNLTDENPKKIYTAIGCIDTKFEGIVAQVFTLGIGAAGMIALGCIAYSAFLMQTSTGNPEQIQKAQENITSCITGLILIILSIFILRVLGVDILRIPGFGS